MIFFLWVVISLHYPLNYLACCSNYGLKWAPQICSSFLDESAFFIHVWFMNPGRQHALVNSVCPESQAGRWYAELDRYWLAVRLLEAYCSVSSVWCQVHCPYKDHIFSQEMHIWWLRMSTFKKKQIQSKWTCTLRTPDPVPSALYHMLVSLSL